MTFLFSRGVAMVMAAAFVASACANTEFSPTTPSVDMMTDEFTDTLSQGGQNDHQFTVRQAGSVTVILASISPLASLTIGLAVGTFDGTTCTTVAGTENPSAKVGTTIDGQAGAGTFCVRVYDVGNIIDPATYNVRVNHP